MTTTQRRRGALVLLLATAGCANLFRDKIPATSTPAREARYYRGQDAANFAAGVVVDQGLRWVFPDPKGPHYGLAVIERVATVTALGFARRQWDRGYRESGVLFNLSGAMAWEILHCALDHGCRTPTR